MGVARSGGRVEPERRLSDLDEFEGQWVAVKDGQVVAVAATSRALVYEVHKLGESGKGAVAQYVAPPTAAFMIGVG